MPATSPRLHITLDQGDYDTIQRLAALQGVPMARIVREFVHEIAPVLGSHWRTPWRPSTRPKRQPRSGSGKLPIGPKRISDLWPI